MTQFSPADATSDVIPAEDEYTPVEPVPARLPDLAGSAWCGGRRPGICERLGVSQTTAGLQQIVYPARPQDPASISRGSQSKTYGARPYGRVLIG